MVVQTVQQLLLQLKMLQNQEQYNAPIEFCQGLAPASYNLFDLLTGEDQTGTWYSGLDNTGAVVSNPVDLSGLTPGDYNFTFDVDAIGSCDDVLVTVTVTINPLTKYRNTNSSHIL